MNIIESALASELLGRHLFPAGVDDLEKQRLLLKAFLLVLILCILAGFGGYNFFIGEELVASATALMGLGFLTGLYNLKNPRVRTVIFRISLAVMTAAFLFYLVTGKHSGTTILWMYTLPPILFFLLGREEGLYWIGPVGLCSIVLLLWPDLFRTYPYETQFKSRFLVSFGMVSLFSYMVEMFRHLAYRKVLEEKDRLEKALEENRMLREILPICSFCKQIRDQEGNWQQLEAYFQERGEIDFSHGICPACARKHYPELDRNLRLTGF